MLVATSKEYHKPQSGISEREQETDNPAKHLWFGHDRVVHNSWLLHTEELTIHAYCMSSNQKIVHGRGTSNINLGIFVCFLMFLTIPLYKLWFV